MIVYRDQRAEVSGAYTTTIGEWQPMKSRRWVLTWLRGALPTRTMGSMWVPGPSFTTPRSHITGTGARWKRFLWQVSLADTQFGSDRRDPVPCGVRRSFGERARESEKTIIAC